MNLKLISKYRNEMFGLAIISIIIFHFTEDFYIAYKSGEIGREFFNMLYFKVVSSIGVDVFMFLSGMGLFYAMSKNISIKTFYKNRMKRLLIPYAIVGIVFWCIRDFVLKDRGIERFLQDFSLLSIFTKGDITLWFIGAMVIIYFLFPVIFKIIENEKWQKSLEDGITFAVLIIISGYILKMLNPFVFNRVEIIFMRIPVFIIGACFAKMMLKDVKMKWWVTGLIILSGFCLKLCDLIFKYPVFYKRVISGVYAVALILICCLVLEALKWTKVYKGLSKVGEYSLELYMTHVTIRCALDVMGYNLYDIKVYSVVVIGSIVSSIFLHLIVNMLTGKRKGTIDIREANS